MKRFMLLASLAVVSALSMQAQVFTENFESYSAPSGSLTGVGTAGTFGPWTVSAGSIEILNSYPGLPARGGTQNLDMDGGTSSAGTINRTFTATAGATYTLTYFYAGNQRGGSPDTMTVSLGLNSVTHSNVPSAQGYTLGTISWTAASTGTANVTFATTGGDNVGILLDDVTLVTNVTGTPTLTEWGMLSLTAMLVLFGAYKAKTKAGAIA